MDGDRDPYTEAFAMTPTAHLRWFDTTVEEPFGVHGLVLRKTARILQQFVEIAPEESGITLPCEPGPDGRAGRWMDIPITDGYSKDHSEGK